MYKGENIEKSRIRFLKIFKKLHEEYAHDDAYRRIFVGKIKKEREESVREALVKTGIKAYYSQVNYHKIEKLTLRKDSVFGVFYDWEEKYLEELLKVLSTTELFLGYFETYNFDRLRDGDSILRLIEKYKVVIEDLEAIKNISLVEPLKRRVKSLEAQRKGEVNLTEKRIFGNLLYVIFKIMVEKGEKKIPNSVDPKIPMSIATITNKIIKEYFNYEINFSDKNKVRLFSKYGYEIEVELSEPLSLYHSE